MDGFSDPMYIYIYVCVSQVAGIGSTNFETINSLASVATIGKIHRIFSYLPKHL